MEKSKTQKNKEYRALAAVALCAVLIFGMAAAIKNYSYAAEQKLPTMYVNDEPWFNEVLYKWHTIFLVDYIPIDMFAKIDGITIKENKNLRNVLISYGTSGSKYITINTDTSTMYTSEGDTLPLVTYILYKNERYVPVNVICSYFGLKLEKTPDGVAIRICDSSAKKSFSELLFTYNVPLAQKNYPQDTETDTGPGVTTDSPDTSEGPQTEEIRAQTIYLTFEDLPNEYTGQILEILNSYDCKAAFFVVGNYITSNNNNDEYADLVRLMMIEGHSVGLHTMTHDETKFTGDIQLVLNELNAENDLLYNITMQKTRLFLFPEGTKSGKLRIQEEDILLLEQHGYAVCDWDADMFDYSYIKRDFIKEQAVKSIAENDGEQIVLRFRSTAQTVAALPLVLDYIKQYPQLTILQLNDTVT